MPFIIAKTNVPVGEDAERELKSAFGRAISLVPGKSEDYLLVEVQDKCRLYLRGKNNEPIAYVTASIFGNESHAGLRELTAEITRAFGEILGVPPTNVYIKYEDISVWGAGGATFDRREFG